MLPEVAADLVFHLKHYLNQRLRDQGAVLLTSTTLKALGPGWAEVEDDSGRRRLEGFETIVLATGAEANDHLGRELKKSGFEVFLVGDARQARGMLEALFEAEEAALEI